MRNSTPIFAAVLMLTALCCLAHADTSTDTTARTTGRRLVHYGDLNLNDETDAKIMLKRIARAAKSACGGHATMSSYTGSVDRYTFDECRVKAIQRTVRQLGAPVVTRIYFDPDSSRIAARDDSQR